MSAASVFSNLQNCALEQGRWQWRGVAVSESRVYTHADPHASIHTAQQQRGGNPRPGEPVANFFQEYLPVLETLVQDVRELEYLTPIAAALASSQRPDLPQPQNDPLLRGTLHSSMSCALPGVCSTPPQLRVCSLLSWLGLECKVFARHAETHTRIHTSIESHGGYAHSLTIAQTSSGGGRGGRGVGGGGVVKRCP